MITLKITLLLHTPTRIATGRAARGLDAVLDPDTLPASSLKGVMRAAATEILGLQSETVSRLFGGTGGQPAPWAWSDVDLTGSGGVVSTRVRIPIDPETGVAAAGGLFHAEELWVDQPLDFTIRQSRPTADAQTDALLLAASAMSVKGIGAARRRGLGWTTMTAAISGQPVSAQKAAKAVARARGAS
ncbi:MAG: RAMP superfamily CRISPR-associated protein [Candidatus Nanopelagicales bacterium]